MSSHPYVTQQSMATTTGSYRSAKLYQPANTNFVHDSALCMRMLERSAAHARESRYLPKGGVADMWFTLKGEPGAATCENNRPWKSGNWVCGPIGTDGCARKIRLCRFGSRATDGTSTAAVERYKALNARRTGKRIQKAWCVKAGWVNCAFITASLAGGE